jgi:sterol 3beta-glucosyltransferase
LQPFTMRIGIQTWGSEGDIRPFVALAGGLSAAGHTVTLVVTDVDDRGYTPAAKCLGFTVRHVATPVVPSPEEFEAIGVAIIKEKNPFRQALAITRQLFDPVIEPMYEAANVLCAESDMVVGHSILHPLGIAAEQWGVPHACVMLAPVTIPSRYKGPSGMPTFGPWSNLLGWWLMGKVIDWKLLSGVNALRARAGLPPASDMMRAVWASPYLNLLAASPVICPPQPDWPVHVRVCGFFNLPEQATGRYMPQDMKEFLRAGEPPVYMTFGSLTPTGTRGSHELDNMIELFSLSAQQAGCRAIVQVPEGAAGDFPGDERIFFTPPVPHGKVFPHCRVIIHHGGAGTTQTATLAGVPSVVVAHIAEQGFWAAELKERGIAPKVLWRRGVTSRLLGRRIRCVLDTPGMKERAGRLGSAMKGENGVARAVEEIERWAREGFRVL